MFNTSMREEVQREQPPKDLEEEKEGGGLFSHGN